MERIGQNVRGALRRVGVPDAGALAAVTHSWAAAVGPAIARAAWPLRISRDGTLHVAASSASWAHELSLLEPEIRAKLEAELGPSVSAPASIRFAVGPVPEPGHDPEQDPVAAPRPTVEESAVAAAVASAIDDPELRAIVGRAAAASLAARRSGRSV